MVARRVPWGLPTPTCTCDIPSVQKPRLRRSASGPQAVGEESQPQKAEEGEQRPAEPVPERAGAHGGEPQPEGGPGPRAEPLAHRLQDEGCLPGASGRGHAGRGHVPGSVAEMRAFLPPATSARPPRPGAHRRPLGRARRMRLAVGRVLGAGRGAGEGKRRPVGRCAPAGGAPPRPWQLGPGPRAGGQPRGPWRRPLRSLGKGSLAEGACRGRHGGCPQLRPFPRLRGVEQAPAAEADRGAGEGERQASQGRPPGSGV